MEHFQISVIVW